MRLRVQVPAAAVIRWQGARPIEQDASWSVAEVPITTLDEYPVAVSVEERDGSSFAEEASLQGVDISSDQVSVGPLSATATPMKIDPNHVNLSTMRYYFADESIAALRELGPDRFSTSIARWIDLAVAIDPQELAPLVEWRLDGQPLRPLGDKIRLRVFAAHSFDIEAGPADAAAAIRLQAYLVKIVTHRKGDRLLDGIEETFSVVTEPPGHEDEVTWLASTKYGSSDPVLGAGESFSVQFDDTFGIRNPISGRRSQWLGVKADHAKFGQDARSGPLGDDLAIDPDWSFDPSVGRSLSTPLRR